MELFYDRTEEMPTNFSNSTPEKAEKIKEETACLIIHTFDDGGCPSDKDILTMKTLQK